MNRRSLLAGAALAVSGLQSEVSFAREGLALFRREIVTLSQRTPRNSEITPTPVSSPVDEDEELGVFDFNSLSPQQTMYVGMLATWFELYRIALGNLQISFEGSESDMLAAIRENTGLQQALASDAALFIAPHPFTQAHDHLANSMSYSSDSLDDIQLGLLTGNSRLIDSAVNKIGMATEEIDLFHESMPFKLPNRLIVED